MKRILYASTCLLVFIPAFAGRPMLAAQKRARKNSGERNSG